jgi:hypothetical protein
MEKLRSEEVRNLCSSSRIKIAHLLGVGLTLTCSTNHKRRLSEEKVSCYRSKKRLEGSINIYVQGIRCTYIWCDIRFVACSQSHFTADSQSVSQYVLVSSPLCGRLTRYCFLFKCLGLEFVVLSLWGALSDERPGLSFVSAVRVTLRLTVSQSVSVSWCRANFVDVWPDIASFSSVWVWNLLSCLCWAPSLTKGRVCPL